MISKGIRKIPLKLSKRSFCLPNGMVMDIITWLVIFKVKKASTKYILKKRECKALDEEEGRRKKKKWRERYLLGRVIVPPLLDPIVRIAP